MGRIYLVRHGETPKNKLKIVQPADEPLSEDGFNQARLLAEALKQTAFNRVLCSDQPRALQTAQTILAGSALPITRTPLLRERNFGALRGRSYEDIGFDFFAENYTPQGGESWTVFHRRVDQAWEAIINASEQCDEGLLVVTHGLVCRRIVNSLCANPGGFVLPDKFGNTSVSIIEGIEPFNLVQVDDTSHLSQTAAEQSQGIV